MADGALAQAYAFCEAEVRRDDPDRWLASLFWPSPARPYIHALLAFNLEIAKVSASVSDPMLGEVRYQWWRDAIEAAAPAGNPVAIALVDTIQTFNLDTERLLALIEARSFDLYDDPMPSMDALEHYARDTSSTLFEAIARILKPGHLPSPAVDSAGRAYALTGLLRGLPYQVMRGQIFLPLDVLARFQCPAEHVLAHHYSPAIGLVLTAMRAKVRVHLSAMDEALKGAGHSAACLPAFLCEPLLKRMETPDLDPFQTPIDLPRLRRLAVLWRGARALR